MCFVFFSIFLYSIIGKVYFVFRSIFLYSIIGNVYFLFESMYSFRSVKIHPRLLQVDEFEVIVQRIIVLCICQKVLVFNNWEYLFCICSHVFVFNDWESVFCI